MNTNFGILNRSKNIQDIISLQKELGHTTTQITTDVLNAIHILPEDKRTIQGISNWMRKKTTEEIVEKCLTILQRSGAIYESYENSKPCWHSYNTKIWEEERKIESYIKRSHLLKEFYDGDKISYHKVTEQRKILERSLLSKKLNDTEQYRNIVEALRKRNLKEAAFLYVELSPDKRDNKIFNSLSCFLEHLYHYYFHSVVLNEEFSIGEDFVDSLTKDERKILATTLNIFLADGKHFGEHNLHEVSNLSVQMAISKASGSPDSIKSQLDSINEKLTGLPTATAFSLLFSYAGKDHKFVSKLTDIGGKVDRKKKEVHFKFNSAAERMKFRKKHKDMFDNLKENSGIANAIGTSGAVASLGPYDVVGDPPVHPKKKRKKFAGRDVFEVTDDEYMKCMPGTIKYERWAKVFGEDSEIGYDIKNYSQRNPNKSFVIQNKKSGDMMYFTRHDNPKRR